MSSILKPKKDSQWLEIEICKDFLQKGCSNAEICELAHPEKHLTTVNGKVIACYDSLKGKKIN
jgi:hypothetical protein